MIFDKIENIKKYNLFDTLDLIKIDDYLKNKNYQKGKFEINQELLFGIGLDYITKNEQDCAWEAHKEYIDIHYILEGKEFITVSDISVMKPINIYNLENDYQLFDGYAINKLKMTKGYFLILFPNECHQTGIAVNGASNVRKIVFKLKLKL